MSRATHWRWKWYELAWLGVPVAIWFAYQPLIRLGQDGTMNYELSVTMLYVTALALMSLLIIWRQRRELVRMRAVWVVGAFVVVSMASLLWTLNLTRGILTVGVTGVLFAIFLGAVVERARLRRLLPRIIRVYMYSALVMCGLALVQFFAGLWLHATTTLLCAGCVAEQFGFVRPNVFLIEPQFLGSALLPAALLLLYRAVTKTGDWRIWAALSVVLLVLVLTLSRGALLALAVGIIVLFVCYPQQIKRWLLAGGVCMVSLSSALGLQGIAAVLHPGVQETFVGAVTKSIHQLTMGMVDVRPTSSSSLTLTSTSELAERSSSQETSQASPEPRFDGYVEESTSARTTRSSLALRRWSADPGTMIFGVGIGSAGLAIHEMFPEKLGAREIVQNEYVEILLERGLIGLVGFLALLGGVYVVTRGQKWLWAMIAAYMVQWLFFSGYPNALHVYVALVVMAAAHLPFYAQKSSAKP